MSSRLPREGKRLVDSTTQCEICHIGTRHPQRTTYTVWVDGRLILLPNVTAWVCDVCADAEYESEAIEWLELLLGIEPDLGDTDQVAGTRRLASNLSLRISDRRRSV